MNPDVDRVDNGALIQLRNVFSTRLTCPECNAPQVNEELW
jgi:hypothetical protein